MTIKSILCLFDGLQDELNALNTAMVLGKTYGARIRVLHVASDPNTYDGMYGGGIIVSASVIEAVKKDHAERVEKAKHYTASFAAKYHLPLDEAEKLTHHADVRFQHRVGAIDPIIAQEGRLSDLIVISQEVGPVSDRITPALFDTGRPVLIVPRGQDSMAEEFKDKTVAFAWNGGLEAARALFNALPLLGRVEKLYVLMVEQHEHDSEAEAGVMEYLHAHRISAQAITIAAGNYRTTGEALLMRAKEVKADLLVMGAYGHSILREMVLGGVTEHMLQKADMPLLLSH